VFTLGKKHADDLRRALDEVGDQIAGHDMEYPLTAEDGSALIDPETGEDVGTSRRSLRDVILDLATGKHSQRALIAGAPSPTVLSLPDDFVHYCEPRTLTVREMARIQSFPDSFVFRSKETTGSFRRRVEVPQYTQVGNAVPPLLARAVARHLGSVLDRLAPAADRVANSPVATTRA
jgi:DNA (cytosine-5)-methyltransferase 1